MHMMTNLVGRMISYIDRSDPDGRHIVGEIVLVIVNRNYAVEILVCERAGRLRHIALTGELAEFVQDVEISRAKEP